MRLRTYKILWPIGGRKSLRFFWIHSLTLMIFRSDAINSFESIPIEKIGRENLKQNKFLQNKFPTNLNLIDQTLDQNTSKFEKLLS